MQHYQDLRKTKQVPLAEPVEAKRNEPQPDVLLHIEHQLGGWHPAE